MKPQSQFNSEEEQQAAARQEAQPAPLEFATAEELLRHDARHTPVPPGIARRLQESLLESPPPRRPWWRRLFGRV